ncbi:LysR family transcriptional regulator [Streptomyces nojiriensis]
MDLNLLRVLDALLQDNSVTRAAERLGTSPAAVSRTLARLRRTVGDPLLVRAGQGLVPTPRATELREEVASLLRRCDNVLRPGAGFDAVHLQRTFTVQATDLLLAGVAGGLTERIHAEAPRVDVVFLPEAMEGGPGLRQGSVDVELGVLGHLDPEILTRQLTRMPLVGIARSGHPSSTGGSTPIASPKPTTSASPGSASASGPSTPPWRSSDCAAAPRSSYPATRAR